MSTRIWQLAAVAALAAVVVALAAIASSSSGTAADAPARTVSRAPAGAFAGLPERDGVLGDPAAPVTITEFLDLQCAACAASARTTLPALLERVRAGDVKLRAELLHFLGPDSVTAARYAAAAAEQGRLWAFLASFYGAQGAVNSGYVTPEHLAAVAKAAEVDDATARRAAAQPKAGAVLNRANAAAERLGVDATPTYVVQRDDGPQRVVEEGRLLTELAR